ncbi:Uncharacterised protein [Mycobacteroides abscessus subsp. abscessus]|nr:Uncharacterised protein [Mycobacteroides abscessus subsp. abscessus]
MVSAVSIASRALVSGSEYSISVNFTLRGLANTAALSSCDSLELASAATSLDIRGAAAGRRPAVHINAPSAPFSTRSRSTQCLTGLRGQGASSVRVDCSSSTRRVCGNRYSSR